MTRTPSALPTKTWASLAADGVTVAALATFDATLAPGKDIEATWAKDVTSVEGIEAGWTLGSGGAWSPPAPTPAELVAHALAKQLDLRDGGIKVNVGTDATPDMIDVASNGDGRGLVSGSVQLIGLAAANKQPAPTFPWINDGGAMLTLTGDQMMTVGYKLGAFVQATYAALGSVNAAIAAGTIKTFADVDTAAAWPATTY